MQTIQSWLSAPLHHLHLTPTRCLNVDTVLPLATICIALLASCAVNQGTHDNSATNPRALLDYNAGWSYIMDAGLWTESEEAFRAAHQTEPDWIMGATLAARITQDVDEREQLLKQIDGGYDGVDPDTRLLLEVYIVGIRSANARDRGTQLPEGFADERKAIALRNFAEFVRRHPGETYVHAERLEVIQVGSAEGGLDFILTQVDRCRARLAEHVMARFDAGFPDGETLSGLEARGVEYVGRIRNNAVLNAMAEPHLKRPPGRPPEQPRIWCHEHRYQAGSWDQDRRLVPVVLERPDDLFLHHFWLVTNIPQRRCSGQKLLTQYRQRGKAEPHFGELMDVLNPALSASPRSGDDANLAGRQTATGVYRNNETLFLMHLLA